MKTTLAFIIRCAIASFGLFVVSTTAMSQNRVPLDTIVILQSGNCEMGCPVYRIVIFADGDVLFQGRSRGRKTGAALTHISGDRLDQILEKFKQLDYTHVENTYGLRGSTAQALETMGAIPESISLNISLGTECGNCHKRVNYVKHHAEQKEASGEWLHGDDGSPNCSVPFQKQQGPQGQSGGDSEWCALCRIAKIRS